MNEQHNKRESRLLPASIVIAAVILTIGWVMKGDSVLQNDVPAVPAQSVRAVLIGGGKILPLETEEKLLEELTHFGVIDPDKLHEVTELNLLWAFGMANKNEILEHGPITDERYGGPAAMASVGGWSVSNGMPLDHFSTHPFVTLTREQQGLVERVAKGIYRPCCDNSTYFPDCNHGMAMLGLLELLASQGVREAGLWQAALVANADWFPDAYRTIASYLQTRGIEWSSIDPKLVLGKEYASASGFRKIAAGVELDSGKSLGGGCSVDSEISPRVPSGGGGCGI